MLYCLVNTSQYNNTTFFPKCMRSCAGICSFVLLQLSPTHFLSDGLRVQLHSYMAEGTSSVACHTVQCHFIGVLQPACISMLFLIVPSSVPAVQSPVTTQTPQQRPGKLSIVTVHNSCDNFIKQAYFSLQMSHTFLPLIMRYISHHHLNMVPS